MYSYIHKLPAYQRQLSSCPSPSQGFLLVVACPVPLFSPFQLLHFLRCVYQQGNVTFHTSLTTFLSARCPADWAGQSLFPAPADQTSPPTFPSPSHQPSKGFLSPSLSLSFSTPPTFSANPRRRIPPRESSSLKSSLLPLLLTCRGGGRKRLHSHSPAAGGFAAG